jgi:hypothetical protein
MADRPRASLWRRSLGCGGCLGVIAIGFVALVLVLAPGGDRDGPTSARPRPVPSSPAPVPPTAAPGRAVAVGEEGVLERPGSDGVLMTVSLEDHRSLVAAERELESKDVDARVKGKMSRVALGLSKRMKEVRDGTRVRVRGSNSGGLYVEVLDGEDAGRAGWVPAWCVKALPRPSSVPARTSRRPGR